ADDAQAFVEEGPTRPLLDVSFHDERSGMAVGAYGLILETDDGGANWRSRVGHLENAFGFHFYDIERLGEAVLVAGEAGSLH
ncbi:YCF48-related protein, partial [Leifsonia sp. SIMBA_070]|uniref:YCF48-related protein n=1 Tax=Leifsonia sp. SIMBA_070 TaxID=3085810 RepID=UPI00397A406E